MPAPHPQDPAAFSLQRDRFRAARQVLEEAVALHAFPGAAYGVLYRGETVALDSVGSFCYGDPCSFGSPVLNRAVQFDTVYDIASVSKVVATTALAMRLFDRGLLDLDQPVGELLPEFVSRASSGGSKRAVSMRMLLAHSSGLPGYARLYETCPDRPALIAACFALPLEAEPGTRAEYSDLGFILLGLALERLSGQPLHLACQQEIFGPLDMRHTCFRPAEELRPTIPPSEDDQFFRYRVVQGEVQDENCYVMGGVSGHAGVFSNVPDLLRFAGGILRALGKSGNAIFAPETIRLFGSRQSRPAGTSRALGWDTPSASSSSGHLFSPRSVGHLGYSGTSLWIDLERELAVVLLTNRCWPSRKNEQIRQVRPRFHDQVVLALE